MVIRPGVHVVITGAGSGIGAATAKELSRHGAKLTLMGRNAQKLSHVAAILQDAHCVAVDVSSRQAVDNAFAKARSHHGPIGILVNNAGISPSAPFLKIDDEHWRNTLATNLDGPFFCTQAALPDMVTAKWGRVINIASTAGLKGYAYVGAYCASKHGLIGLTRALAQEVARLGITVNAVCPGFADTEMSAQSVDRIAQKTGLDAEAARARLAAFNPQVRLIPADEIAAAVSWLCSDAATSVNGTTLAVAGGEV